MKITLIFMLCISAQLLFAKSNRTELWRKDLEVFRKELPQKHISLFWKLDKEEFNKDLNKISEAIPKLSDFQVAMKLQQLVVKVGDTHTKVNLGRYIDKSLKQCFECYWFKDGLYIMRTRARDSSLLGTKIVSIGEKDLSSFVDSVKSVIFPENSAIIKGKVAQMISHYQLLEYFGFANDKDAIKLKVEDSEGKVIPYVLSLKPERKTYQVAKSSKHLIVGENNGARSLDGWFVDYYNEASSIYYVQYNKCYSRELARKQRPEMKDIDLLPSFDEFTTRIFETLENEKVHKFVFDMRFNGGGNSWQGTQLIRKLAKSELLKGQKIFVLIGRSTFSSAIINTCDFREITDAIIVGEETAGKASHFGEVRSFKLPNSQLAINYSTKFFYHYKGESITYREKDKLRNKAKKDKRKTITPDHIVELSFEDYKKNHDPVLEWVLKYN